MPGTAAIVPLIVVSLFEDFRFILLLAVMLQQIRFMMACPLLLIDIGFVLLGSIALTRKDRHEVNTTWPDRVVPRSDRRLAISQPKTWPETLPI